MPVLMFVPPATTRSHNIYVASLLVILSNSIFHKLLFMLEVKYTKHNKDSELLIVYRVKG